MSYNPWIGSDCDASIFAGLAYNEERAVCIGVNKTLSNSTSSTSDSTFSASHSIDSSAKSTEALEVSRHWRGPYQLPINWSMRRIWIANGRRCVIVDFGWSGRTSSHYLLILSCLMVNSVLYISGVLPPVITKTRQAFSRAFALLRTPLILLFLP